MSNIEIWKAALPTFALASVENRTADGQFFVNGYIGYFWSSSEYDAEWAYYRQLEDASSHVLRQEGMKGTGFSVRCVKD